MNAGATWTLDPASTFDAEWVWLSTFQTWFAANRVFAYPENQLAPNLYVVDGSLHLRRLSKLCSQIFTMLQD